MFTIACFFIEKEVKVLEGKDNYIQSAEANRGCDLEEEGNDNKG